MSCSGWDYQLSLRPGSSVGVNWVKNILLSMNILRHYVDDNIRCAHSAFSQKLQDCHQVNHGLNLSARPGDPGTSITR